MILLNSSVISSRFMRNQSLNNDLTRLFFRSIYTTNCRYFPESSVSSGEKLVPVKIAYTIHDSNLSSTIVKLPLIIMHGLLGSRMNWNSLSKAMSKKTLRKIITVDARNHGDSPHTSEFSYAHLAEDVKALMDSLNIPKASLMGHSMGGRTMMLAALKYPSLVEKLVIVDISPVGTSPSIGLMKGYFDAMKNVKLGKNIPISTARKSADEQLKNAVSDAMLRMFLVTNLVEVDGAIKWRVNLDSLSENFFTNVVDFPMTTPPSNPFKGPTLFIGGGKSDFLKKEDHPAIKKYFPNAEFIYVPDAGHWVHSDKPIEFTDIVSNFLQESN